MKHLIALSAIAAGLSMTAPPSLAQSAPPPLPALTPQQQQEVQVRLKTGESYDSIARSYGVDVATIRQLGQINR